MLQRCVTEITIVAENRHEPTQFQFPSSTFSPQIDLDGSQCVCLQGSFVFPIRKKREDVQLLPLLTVLFPCGGGAGGGWRLWRHYCCRLQKFVSLVIVMLVLVVTVAVVVVAMFLLFNIHFCSDYERIVVCLLFCLLLKKKKGFLPFIVR